MARIARSSVLPPSARLPCHRPCPGEMPPRDGLEPPTARSVGGWVPSDRPAPSESMLLTLGASPIASDPDGTRRIVWMINPRRHRSSVSRDQATWRSAPMRRRTCSGWAPDELADCGLAIGPDGCQAERSVAASARVESGIDLVNRLTPRRGSGAKGTAWVETCLAACGMHRPCAAIRCPGWEASWSCPKTSQLGQQPPGPGSALPGSGARPDDAVPLASQHPCRTICRPLGWDGWPLP
jgi:hypothetical protein